ncbi:MAG: methylated-DNA--[protein]-cysteine S-methyltransferase [Thermoanaerobaculia bacterium]
MTLYAHTFDTPLDRMVAAVDGDGAVVLLVFLNGRSPEEQVAGLGADVEWSAAQCSAVVEAVQSWFAGDADALDAFPLHASGSDFQHRVWREVRKVGWGETASYGEIASRLGRPGASRAVGRANATNPICLAVPCHRIVGSDGSLTGYGGGIATKQALLELERGQKALSLG